MRITKRQTNPSAYALTVGARSFWFTFEPLPNNTNGHPRRLVKVIYNKQGRATYYARSLVIVLNYESEEEAAQQIADIIAKECEN